MPGASTLNSPINPQLQHSELAVPRSNQRKNSLAIGNDGYPLDAPARPKMARHYTTFQEHADAMRVDFMAPGERRSTPQPNDRREGVT
ncbi:unnamed protein product [Periconia digitata]|uniref:Uncharacterized protein n=1 Tax=Periconia digitata TaxID=1303443 RepID=A0A9W4ULZ3_9PLEO|nr:unnamed protein product [Periconia digitata]